MPAFAPYRSEAFAEDLRDCDPGEPAPQRQHGTGVAQLAEPVAARLLLCWPLAVAVSASSLLTLVTPPP